MNEREMIQLVLEKLVSIEQDMKSMKDELRREILMNRQGISELKTEVDDIKQSMRFYNHKMMEYEKEIFKMKS